jgi:NAD(P)-dependent dehydrogenase (short-subunit alcohol dehydrogenase family)
MKGRSVVISGAAFGIGRATAAKFAKEGALLVIQDIQSDPLIAFRDDLRRSGVSAEAVVGDVSWAEDCQAMIRAAVEAYRRVDVVVANAGIIRLGDVLESTVDDWDKVMAIDGRGMFLTCKYAIEAMLKNGGGSIVCISSISGLAGQNRQSTYGPAKFVATGLTKHLAVEWANKGIRVNAVAPGTINTESVKRLPDEPGGVEYMEAIKKAHPMGRIGEPEEVANAIFFLASDEASFITGTVLPVDGGYLASRFRPARRRQRTLGSPFGRVERYSSFGSLPTGRSRAFVERIRWRHLKAPLGRFCPSRAPCAEHLAGCSIARLLEARATTAGAGRCATERQPPADPSSPDRTACAR